jgi:hypothetical protein
LYEYGSFWQRVKKFLLFYNFALIQRCLFKTISFFRFNFISINGTIQKKKSGNDGYAPLAASEARIAEQSSGPHQQHSGASGVGGDGRTATGARCRITI